MSWKRPRVQDRMRFVLDPLPPDLSGNLLDIGTGGGVFAKLLNDVYPRACIHQADLRAFNPLTAQATYSVLQAPAYRDRSFHLILAAQVLHYIPPSRHQKTINALLDRLDNDGILVLVEYHSQRAYSWLPFPVSPNDLRSYDTTAPLQRVIDANDKRRPKYAAYFSHQSLDWQAEF